MSLAEIFKKIRLADVYVYLKNVIRLNISINIGNKNYYIGNVEKLMISEKEFTKIKEDSIETIEKSIGEEEIMKLSDSTKEILAKSVIAGTILINLPELKEKTSKGLIGLDPSAIATLQIKCEKCGKYFGSMIRGDIKQIMEIRFSNNSHQCSNCGNMQLVKDNTDYFISFNLKQV